MPNSACSLVGHLAMRCFCATSATSSMYGLSPSSSNQSATSSRSTDGANGRNDSRYLTLRLSIFCIVGERVAEDRAAAERARPELHAALEPAERLAVGQRAARSVDQRLVAERVERGAGGREPLLDVGLRDSGAEIGACMPSSRAVQRRG